MSIQIVVSRYNEDIAWTKQFPNVVIYNKGADDLSPEYMVKPLPNVGREGHTYYTHICDNYDSQDGYDYTVFLQGNPFDHSPNLITNLSKYADSIPDINIDFEFVSEDILYCKLSGCVWDMSLPLREVYKRVFGDQLEVVDFVFGNGAQFIVSWKQIRSRSKEFYMNIVKMLENEKDPMEGYVIERFHKLIFTSAG